MNLRQQIEYFGQLSDPFIEYKFDPSNPSDQKLIKMYSEGIRINSKICFKKCSDLNQSTAQVQFKGQPCIDNCINDILAAQTHLLKQANLDQQI